MDLAKIYTNEYQFKMFLRSLKLRTIPPSFYYNFLFDRHFINRIDDRNISHEALSNLITKLIMEKLCLVIFHGCRGVRNIYFKDNELIVIAKLTPHSFVLKTIYESDCISHVEDIVIDLNKKLVNEDGWIINE